MRGVKTKLLVGVALSVFSFGVAFGAAPASSPFPPVSLPYQGIYAATVVAPGIGYKPGDLAIVAGGVTKRLANQLEQARFIVSVVKLLNVPSINSAGTGCTGGTTNLIGTTGIGLFFQVSATTVAGGGVTSINSIVTGGDYSTLPTTLSAEPVTGGGCTGVMLTVDPAGFGADYLWRQNPGNYTFLPLLSGVSPGSTDGSGTGLTMNLEAMAQGLLGTPTDQNPAVSISPQIENWFSGPRSGQSNTTGGENTAFGDNSLSQNKTGNYNVALGVSTMGYGCTNCMYSTAVGNDAMRNTLSGFADTALGRYALGAMTQDGGYNTAIGWQALMGATTSNPTDMTAVGQYAAGGTRMTTPSKDVFIGSKAGQLIAGAFQTTGVGFQSLQNVFNGNYDTGLGSNSCLGMISNGQTTCIGANTGTTVTGGNNTMLGAFVASTTLTSGTGNILIGTSVAVDTPTATTNNYMDIGNLLIGDVAKGILNVKGPIPTLSNCGTGPTIETNSNNTSGTVTIGVGGTGCTITFANANSAVPHVNVTSRSGGNPSYTVTASTIVLSGVAAGGTFDYMALGGSLVP